MITITDLAMQYGDQTLFANANLQLGKGSRYGIVGANGSGKSTLLKILASQLTPSEGDFTMPRSARVGVLGQDHFEYENTAVLDVVMMGNRELWDAIQEKDALLERAHEHFDDDRYVELEDIVIRFDGYSLESRAAQILEGLGIPTEKHQLPMSALSGGYKLRALLGQVLASEPDILLLDEPTNHLDILAIRWLEQFLERFKGCAVVVSHDLHFLESVCTHILDIDYERVTSYTGNYTSFERQKEEERARQEGEISKREKEIDQHKAFITRFKAKATKARQANSRQKRLDKIEIVSLPRSSRRSPSFRFKARRKSGRTVLTVKDVSKAYGDNQVLDGVGFELRRGDRLAVIGPNGIGKSTLLKILVGQLEADKGEANWGYEADFGYFPQDHQDVLSGPKHTVKTALWEVCPTLDMGNIMGRLASVLFSRDDVDKKVENLSGGEAARLLFARISAVEPTVLVLDEPTNHLDIESIAALSKALKAYDGTLILVSHDRWFVERVATRVLEIRHDGVTDYPGTYREYANRSSRDHLDREAVVAKAKQERKSRKKGKKKKSGGAGRRA